MKLFTKKNKNKKKDDYLIIKNGKNDTRKYPKKTLLISSLTHDK